MPKITRLGLTLTLTSFILLGPGPGLSSGPATAAGPPKPRPESVSTSEPRPPEEELKGFHVPAGFAVELVAAEPEIRKPLNLAFDDRGRLWVTETVEYPFPAKGDATPRDGVKILEDIGPDGRARTIRTFAEGLNIPIGLLPLPGGNSALVHSIPDVLRLTDDDGDGHADRREPLYATYGAKDTHGMTNAFTWGFDGWVYACHGFSNTSTVQGADRAPITMQSGNVYRMRPDGSHLEYYSHGQVNPFGLAFDHRGNLYSCDCHSRPLYQLLRGAWYPSFGKPHDGLGFGPEMVKHDHGSTAISGISCYEADHFPESYRGSLFIGNVVTNRINHDRVAWHGSTPEGIAQPDFLWSEDNWFRPVDIELGPDGALYVADFYNRIIGHYEVPLTHPGRDRRRGRIWRIVYRGEGTEAAPAPRAPRHDWNKAGVADLVADLGHPNLTVRFLAANRLAAPGAPDAGLKGVATSDGNALRRAHALWILERRGDLDEQTLTSAAGDRSAVVRGHARRVLGERPALPGTLRELALRGLSDEDAQVRRDAAEALGRHPDPANLRPLLDLRQSAPADDTHLIHAVRIALRDQLRDDPAWNYVETMPRSDRDDRDISDVALGVPSAAAARFLLDQIRHGALARDPLTRSVHHVARHGEPATEPDLVAFIAGRGESGPAAQAALLKAYQQGIQERGGKPGDATRALALDVSRGLLDSKKKEELLTGIQLVGGFGLGELQDRLASLGGDKKAVDAARTAALTALSTIAPEKATAVLGQVLGDPSNPIALREQAAGALGSGGREGSDGALLAALPTAPGRLQSAIAAGLAARPAGATALLDAVAAGKASARVLQEPRVASALEQAKLPGLKPRLDGLLAGQPPADQRLRELLNFRRRQFESAGRDPALGAQVFEKNCTACHQIRGRGARVGPQLDGVGVRGVDRLLEDVLDPNRNVDQSFRTTRLALDDGRIVTGLLLREEGEVVVLADPQGKEVRIPRDSVEEQAFSPLSPMPANFADQIPEAEFYHLLDFLLSSRPEANPGEGK